MRKWFRNVVISVAEDKSMGCVFLVMTSLVSIAIAAAIGGFINMVLKGFGL